MYNVVVDPREPVGRREDHHPLDDVAKLANIAGPVVRLERGHRLGADLGRRHATFGGVAADEMIAQRCDIRSEEQTSELPPLMSISYAVFCLQKTKYKTSLHIPLTINRVEHTP